MKLPIRFTIQFLIISQKSPFDERLYVFQKGDYGGDDSDQVLIGVVTFDGTQGAYSSFETPMLANSSITFSIRYLY